MAVDASGRLRPAEPPRSPPELVVVTQPEFAAPSLWEAPPRVLAEAVPTLQRILAEYDARMRPLFAGTALQPEAIGAPKAVARREAAQLLPDPVDLSRFYSVEAPVSEFGRLAERLGALPFVEAAYVKPPSEPPVLRLNDMAPVAGAPAASADFTSRQGYLRPAPEGVDATYAWTVPGGRGAGVRVIDCEWGWNFTHEDLLLQQNGVVVGGAIADDDHGTAVIGEVIGNRNTFGVTGIVPDAVIAAASFEGKPSAETIREAADKLSPGDILLLEIHRGGPNSNGDGQYGFIGIEWWPDDFVAIRYAVGKGIVVVEAAGNGHQNLDEAVYDQRPTNFPKSWRNPFNPANPSSGAILVGAGNPPSGTHGRTTHPDWGEVYVDRARCVFSNFGQRVDCQGWGWEVTTAGYGDLQGGGNRDVWYSDQFSGTSSASPIVAGVVAALQGVLKAQGRAPLTSLQAISLLRASGSPQQDAPGRPKSERIGNRPNLRDLIAAASALV